MKYDGPALLALLSPDLREGVKDKIENGCTECHCETPCPEDSDGYVLEGCPSIGTTLVNVMASIEDIEDIMEDMVRGRMPADAKEKKWARKILSEIFELYISLGIYRAVTDEEYRRAYVIPARAKSKAYPKHKGVRYENAMATSEWLNQN